MVDQQIFEQNSNLAIDGIAESDLDQPLTEHDGTILTPTALPLVCHRAISSVKEAPSQVWVNCRTSIFHRAGRRWFERTKHGELMSRKEALASGYRAAGNGQ